MITFKAKTPQGDIINSALSPFIFPAGEAHIKREEQRDIERTEIALFQPSAESLHTDLMLLSMWSDYLARESPEANTVVVLGYAPGARADRGFPFGAGVYGEFLSNQYFDQILVFDPHSNVAIEELHALDNITVLYPEDLFDQSHIKSYLPDYTGIIAPDKGAVARAAGVADVLDLPVYTATKTRDFETGKLTGFHIEDLPETGRFLIVDDICDGGGTFLGLADATGLPPESIDLYVSHGVFSKLALHNLSTAFGRVFTTNTYNPSRDLNKDIDTDHTVFHRLDVIRLLLGEIKY